jgi:hypothetical protein
VWSKNNFFELEKGGNFENFQQIKVKKWQMFLKNSRPFWAKLLSQKKNVSVKIVKIFNEK